MLYKQLSNKYKTCIYNGGTDYWQTLIRNKNENRLIVSAAEDILFTTFTKELADKIQLLPRYVSEKAEELNAALWDVVKWYFSRWNATHCECFF